MRLLDTITISLAGLMVGNELALSAFVNPAICQLESAHQARGLSILARSLGRVMPVWYGFCLALLALESFLHRRQAALVPLLTATLIWAGVIIFYDHCACANQQPHRILGHGPETRLEGRSQKVVSSRIRNTFSEFIRIAFRRTPMFDLALQCPELPVSETASFRYCPRKRASLPESPRRVGYDTPHHDLPRGVCGQSAQAETRRRLMIYTDQNKRTKGGLRMEEIEDSLMAFLAEFNTRTGRKIELLPSSPAPTDPAYVVFSLRDLSSDESRLLTLCIFDLVEPWGKVGLPEAVGQINDAVVNFWSEGIREPNRTVYIPPKYDGTEGSP